MDFLKEVERHLDLPPAEKEQVLRELESHFREGVEELHSSGMRRRDAALEAARRLGDPSDIAQRMQTVHCRASWKSALLAGLPFLVSILCISLAWLVRKMLVDVRDSYVMSSPTKERIFKAVSTLSEPWTGSTSVVVIGGSLLLLSGLAMLVASVRELRAGKRPFWLPTCFAAGIITADWLVSSAIGLLAISIEYQTLDVSAKMIPVGAVAAWVVALASCWKTRRLRRTILIIACVGILPFLILSATRLRFVRQWLIFDSSSSAWIVWACVMSVSAVILWMISALQLFSFNKYSSPAQCSLFLLALYALRAPSHFSDGYMPMDNVYLLAWIPILMIAAGVVITSLRQVRWTSKLAVLSIGILLMGVWSMISAAQSAYYRNWQDELAGFGGMKALIMVMWVVLVPMLFERSGVSTPPIVAE